MSAGESCADVVLGEEEVPTAQRHGRGTGALPLRGVDALLVGREAARQELALPGPHTSVLGSSSENNDTGVPLLAARAEAHVVALGVEEHSEVEVATASLSSHLDLHAVKEGSQRLHHQHVGVEVHGGVDLVREKCHDVRLHGLDLYQRPLGGHSDQLDIVVLSE